MPIGMGKQKFPPPWLVAMQRYGPPPSYPHLKILGLNAPIPEVCGRTYCQVLHLFVSLPFRRAVHLATLLVGGESLPLTREAAPSMEMCLG